MNNFYHYVKKIEAQAKKWFPYKKKRVCPKLAINTPVRRHWRRYFVFMVNFKHISYLFVLFLLLTLSK